LTPSEIDVLRLVAQDLDIQSIVTALAKSEKTVRNQVSAVFGKLRVKTRAEAVVKARDAEIGGPSE
jgi:DNA-binding NarL/FixJ family response regulator